MRSFGMLSISLLAWSSMGPTAWGMVVSFMAITEPSSRYGPESVRGRRSTYCSPTADTLSTLACRSDGIFGEVFSVSVASAPTGVSLTSVTLPTSTPR